jgi:hypothetical protein
VGTLEVMTLLLVAGAAVLFLIAAASLAIWVRRHRARRDLEGHFQNEWVNRERWASLADGDPHLPDAGRSQSTPISTDQ